MLKGTFFKKDRDIFSLFSEQLNKGAHDDDYFYEWSDYDDISEPEEFQKSFNHNTDLSDKEKEYIQDRCRYFRIYDIMSVSEKNVLAHSASGEWRS